MKPYYLPVLVLMACAVNAYAQNSNAQTVSLGVDKSKKPDHENGPNFANRNLSNLFQTSINTDLLPDDPSKRNLGSLNHSWKNLYLTGSIYLDGKRFISNKGEFGQNTFIGSSAGLGNTTGNANTAVGFEALFANTEGYDNVAIGLRALTNNTTGFGNTANGTTALFSNTTGIYNSAFGFNALSGNTTGEGNTATGLQALYGNTVGNFNSAFGFASLASNINGNENTACGSGSLGNNTEGFSNTASGTFALVFNTTGFWNTAIGRGSLFNNTVGFQNTAIGMQAFAENRDGVYNTAVGGFSLNRIASGHYNTAIGAVSLQNLSNGSMNTAVGMSSGVNKINITSGTLLGASTNSNDNLSNFTAIGFTAYAFENNQVVVGNSSVTSIGGYANWSNFSDGRYKSNIKENVPGLSFITQLRPVTYTLNVDGIENIIKAASPDVKNNFEITFPNGVNHPSNMSRGEQLKTGPTDQELKASQDKAKLVYTGFVAQEVEKLAKEINYDFSGVDAPKSENGFYSLRYGDFVVPLVKAVQELNKKNEELEQRIQKLEVLLSNNEESLLNNKADKKSNESVIFSSARLEQNTPNPSNGSTTIRYYIPAGVSSASIVVSDMKGIVIKNIPLTKKGSGQINIERGILASGTYSYSLLIDGKQIDSRLMIIAR